MLPTQEIALSLQQFGMILGVTVMTPTGKAILTQVKLSGFQCVTVNMETGKEKRYHPQDVKPIMKPVHKISVKHAHERRKIENYFERIMWELKQGYDSLNWIDEGFAILETE